MVAEVCARFGGYPSSYQSKTLGDLCLDYEAAELLAETEKRAYNRGA